MISPHIDRFKKHFQVLEIIFDDEIMLKMIRSIEWLTQNIFLTQNQGSRDF